MTEHRYDDTCEMETKVIIILASKKPTHRQDICKTGNIDLMIN